MLQARQPSEDIPLDNLNLISLRKKIKYFFRKRQNIFSDLQIECVDLFAELPAVILDVVDLIVTQTQDLEGDQSVQPAFVDRYNLRSNFKC